MLHESGEAVEGAVTGAVEGATTALQATVEQVALLLLIAAVVALIAQRMKLPYTVGLVLAGVGLAFANLIPTFTLTKDLIFVALLPPLIFEAAFYIRWPELKHDLAPVLTLAAFSVLIGAGIVATGMHYLAKWDWPVALLFGSLIAATDPVSVIAVFKEAGIHGRLRLLMEAESLMNDGAAAVVFTVVLALVSGESLGVGDIALKFFLMVVGGIACGLILGWGILMLAGRTEDPLVEITFTTVAAYGSFLLAEHFHFSGVLATMACGILLGNVGSLGAISDRGRAAVGSFWEYAAFVANSLIFLLIGIKEAKEPLGSVLVPLLFAIGLVTFARASVYPICAVFNRTPGRIDRRHQHILFWGGLRGALSLALVLGLPEGTPFRTEITAVAFGVVAFSIVVQGITITPLLRRLDLMHEDPEPVAPWEEGPVVMVETVVGEPASDMIDSGSVAGGTVEAVGVETPREAPR